jgi:hypothetical protein
MRNTTMRTLIATLCLLAAAAPAGAQSHAISRADNPAGSISRYNAATMSCAEAQSRIQAEGAVVLRYRATDPSMPHYGRYVDSMHYCSADELLAPTSIPTADTKSCRVVECVINR